MSILNLAISRTGIISLVLAGLLATVWGVDHYVVASRLAASQQAAAEAKRAADRVALVKEAFAKADADAEAKERAEAAEMANFDHVAHKGQGPEHVLIRKLMAYPSIIDGLPEQFTGDRDDPKALKEWAGHEAHVLTKDSGIIGKFSEQYKIKAPDTVAFDIVKDPTSGDIKVVQYAASTLVEKASADGETDTAAEIAPPTSIAPKNIVLAGGESFSQVAAFTVASTAATAQVPFVTNSDGTIVFHSPFAYIDDGVPYKKS